MADEIEVELEELVKEFLGEKPDNIVRFKKKKEPKRAASVTTEDLIYDAARECTQGFLVAGIKTNGEVYSFTSALTDLEFIYLIERLRHDHFIEVKIRELEENKPI